MLLFIIVYAEKKNQHQRNKRNHLNVFSMIMPQAEIMSIQSRSHFNGNKAHKISAN